MLLLETLGIAVLLALLLLVIGLLVIPLHVSFRVSRSESERAILQGEFSVRWLGLTLFRRRIPTGRRTRPGAAIATTAAPLPREEVDVLKMLRLVRESFPSFVILLRAFRRAVSVRRLSASVNFGSGDPAETALLSGYLWAFSWIFNLLPRVSLVLTPDLERLRLDGWAAGELGVRLLPLIVGFLRAYSKRPFRALVREARRRGGRRGKERAP